MFSPQLQVELSFATGQIINVYGEMDDDGFYMGEIDGVRGLVPSNFLTEAPDQYGGAGGGQTSQQQQQGGGVGGPTARGGQQRGRRGVQGRGARGPPPPPRETQMARRSKGTWRPERGDRTAVGKNACLPVYTSQLDSLNTSTTPNTITEHQQARARGMLRQGGNQPQQQHQQQLQQPGSQQQALQQQQQFGQQNAMGGLFGTLTGQQQQQPQTQPQQQQQQQQPFAGQNRIQHKGVPQVLPNAMQAGQQQQANNAGAPNLMQKLNEIAAPGGDILSKGKELIFMKFGLGGK
ncbi:hypothetical protein NQ318_016524 [Aromia moschata]|uniref:SH3 domain-containing protein n=1 Tax=Aromia moschata TaxID=1265417 RepID=A0AAV8YWN0_9CUCU|nr:hypothetical protein NQ318_016524 [Aromia moschata]